MAAAIVPVGVCFLLFSFTFASVAAVYRKKYEAQHSYPVLSPDNDSSHLQSVTIRANDSCKYIVQANNSILYSFERGSSKNIWFMVDSATHRVLWTVRLASTGASVFKTHTTYAISSTTSGIDVNILKFDHTNSKYHQFQVCGAQQDPTENRTFRWLYSSRYLEIISPQPNQETQKKIALAIPLGVEKPKNSKRLFHYQIIFNQSEIETAILSLSAFLSIITQWKHLSAVDETLKEKTEQWNENRISKPTDQKKPNKTLTIKENIPHRNAFISSRPESILSACDPPNYSLQVEYSRPKASSKSRATEITRKTIYLKDYERNKSQKRLHIGNAQRRKLSQKAHHKSAILIDKTNKKIYSFLYDQKTQPI